MIPKRRSTTRKKGSSHAWRTEKKPEPTRLRGGTEGRASGRRDKESRTELLVPLIGRLNLDEALVARTDVLASLAAQKKNVESGDLKQPKRGVILVSLANMVHVLAFDMVLGADDALRSGTETSAKRVISRRMEEKERRCRWGRRRRGGGKSSGGAERKRTGGGRRMGRRRADSGRGVERKRAWSGEEERRVRGVVGGRAKDTRGSRGVEAATKETATESQALGSRERGTNLIVSPSRNE